MSLTFYFLESLMDSYWIYCWVRKWSQMIILLIRSTILHYLSVPEWKFISSSTITKPIRTKGAIVIKFKLFQATFLFIGCHLSRLSYVFWLGDMNFRLISRRRLDEIVRHFDQPSGEIMFTHLLSDDELTIGRNQGIFFKNFQEPMIRFPPTHKFIVNSNEYVCNRIPSYTDRILYHCKKSKQINSLKYDIMWEENASDHKPVYGLFAVTTWIFERIFISVEVKLQVNQVEGHSKMKLKILSIFLQLSITEILFKRFNNVCLSDFLYIRENFEKVQQ
ncbi:unnamed protein product [Dracunculus medinensis]|uniref:IPPc domain-containing protein n=1 Tax=Dracunculus medinensis TaxID=318479 RepID=A0A0N4U9Q4_DRAME|nr:unnamed protein product [Dracunculus medinensis]